MADSNTEGPEQPPDPGSDHTLGPWLYRFLRLDQANPQVSLRDQLTDSSRPNFAFFFMLSMAASIATFGLLTNSAPAIIGAMIIAPLMEPIVGISLGTLIGNRKLITLSAVSIATGSAAVIAIGYALTKMIGLSVVGSELLSRTSPSTIDFLVALASGGAAAFAHTRLNIANSIAGVAIAVALVPPLATCGVGLALGDLAVDPHGVALSSVFTGNAGLDMASGAFLLFASNIVGIVALGTVVFAIQRYGHYRRPVFFAVAVIAASIFVMGPLESRLKIVYFEDRVLEAFSKTLADHPRLFSGQGYIDHVDVVHEPDGVVVTIRLFELQSFMDRMADAATEFERRLSRETKKRITLRLQVVPTHLRTFGPSLKDDGAAR